MAKVKTLFKVDIEHDFHQEGINSDFEIVPTPQTSRFLRNHGMLFRPVESGCLVAALLEENELGNHHLRLIPEKSGILQFMMLNRVPHFLSYTNLPFHNLNKKIYYFNNLLSNIIEGNKLLHSAGSKVTASEQENRKSGRYHFQYNGGTKQTVTARLNFPDMGFKEEKVASNNNGVAEFDFQLSDFPTGRAELEVEGAKVDSFYSMNLQDVSKVFGMIEIFFSDEVPSPYQFFDEQGNITQQEYKISFENRKTFWKYIVINKNGENLEDIEIEDNDNIYTFSEYLSDQYPANSKIFVSDQEISLSSEPKGSFSLITKKSSNKRVLVDPLPNPGSEMLKRDEHDKDKLYSEIFFYI